MSIHEKANNAAFLAGGGKNENSCVEKHLALLIPWTKYSSRKNIKQANLVQHGTSVKNFVCAL
jgi:hypothetical protein